MCNWWLQTHIYTHVHILKTPQWRAQTANRNELYFSTRTTKMINSQQTSNIHACQIVARAAATTTTIAISLGSYSKLQLQLHRQRQHMFSFIFAILFAKMQVLCWCVGGKSAFVTHKCGIRMTSCRGSAATNGGIKFRNQTPVAMHLKFAFCWNCCRLEMQRLFNTIWIINIFLNKRFLAL